MSNKKVDFAAINKYKVAISSLKNKLRKAKGVDELTLISGKIIDLEQMIFSEKSQLISKLERKKQVIFNDIDKFSNEIYKAEYKLMRINDKINSISKSLDTSIDLLSTEYTSMNTLLKK